MNEILNNVLIALKGGALCSSVKSFCIGTFLAPTIDNMPICAIYPRDISNGPLGPIVIDMFVYGFVQPSVSKSLLPTELLNVVTSAVRSLESQVFSGAVLISRPEVHLDMDTSASNNSHFTISCTLRLGRQ